MLMNVEWFYVALCLLWRCVQVVRLGICKCTLNCKQKFCRCNKANIGSSWIMVCLMKKLVGLQVKGQIWAQREHPERMPCEKSGRGWRNGAARQKDQGHLADTEARRGL